MTIVSLDGLRFDAINSSGVNHASLIYISNQCIKAKLEGDQIFEMHRLKDDTWVTIFKDKEIEKLIVSIKLLSKNVFSIKSFYGRSKYFVKHSKNIGHFILTNEEKQAIVEITHSNHRSENIDIFEIKAVTNFTLESEWFLILHAVHCALYLVGLSDESFRESLNRKIL